MVANVLALCAHPPDPESYGGVQIHVSALARYAPPSVRVLTAFPTGAELLVETWQPDRRLLAAVPFDGASVDPLGMGQALERAVSIAAVSVDASVLHVHSAALGPRAVAASARRLGLGLVVTLHDHALVCEEYRLLENGTRFCDIPEDLRRCDACLGATHGRPPGAVRAWRSGAAELVAAAHDVIAPSRSVRDLAVRVHPKLTGKVTLVPWGVPKLDVPTTPPRRGTRLRVGVIGVVAPVKGHGVLPELLRACDGLDVEWHLFGVTEGRNLAEVRRAAKVVVHGAYRREELPGLLARARIDVVVLPSIAPETFSLTLSEILAAGLPVIASELGALGERVQATRSGWTFDPHDGSSLRARLSDVLAEPSRLEAAAEHARATPLRSERAMAEDHVPIWRHAAASVRERPADAWASLATAAAEARVLAGARRTGFLAEMVERARRSRVYRDLPARTWLPEATRKKVEAWLAHRRRSGGPE